MLHAFRQLIISRGVVFACTFRRFLRLLLLLLLVPVLRLLLLQSSERDWRSGRFLLLTNGYPIARHRRRHVSVVVPINAVVTVLRAGGRRATSAAEIAILFVATATDRTRLTTQSTSRQGIVHVAVSRRFV